MKEAFLLDWYGGMRRVSGDDYYAANLQQQNQDKLLGRQGS